MPRPRKLDPPEPSSTPDSRQPVVLDGEDEGAGTRAPETAQPPPRLTVVAKPRATSAVSVEGQRASAAAQRTEPLRLLANDFPNFILVYYPDRYDYFPQCDAVLPVFGTIKLVPGIGRVDARGNPDHALVAVGKQGGIAIYDREPEAGYLRVYDMRISLAQLDPVKGYMPRWDKVRHVGNNVKIETDYGDLKAFIAEMTEAGKITMPSALVIESIRDKFENMLKLSEGREAAGVSSVVAECRIFRKAVERCNELLEGAA